VHRGTRVEQERGGVRGSRKAESWQWGPGTRGEVHRDSCQAREGAGEGSGKAESCSGAQGPEERCTGISVSEQERGG